MFGSEDLNVRDWRAGLSIRGVIIGEEPEALADGLERGDIRACMDLLASTMPQDGGVGRAWMDW